MEENGIFQIDTKGICLICLKDCNLYDYFGPNKVKQEIGSCTRSVSFKLLLRYLKINLFQLCSFPPAFLESMDAAEDTDVVIPLCGDCFMLTKSFSRLFESMEDIRMQLDACVQTVYEVMKDGESQEDRLEEYRRRRRSKNMLEMMTANVAEQLRNETIRKCSLKVDALIPRVTMYKRDLTNLKPSSGPMITSTFSQSTLKQSGPQCKVGRSDNPFLKQLLMKPQTKSEFYQHSPSLFNRLANQGQKIKSENQSRGVATKKTRSRNKRANNLPNNVQQQADKGPSSEEMVVKVEPIMTSMSMGYHQFHNERDPLDEMEAEEYEMGAVQQLHSNINGVTGSGRSNPDKAIYHCTECPRKYVKPSLLLRHQIVFHKHKKGSPTLKGKKRRLRCKQCPKLFVSKTNLMLHIRTIHAKGDQSHKPAAPPQSPVKKGKKKNPRNKGVGRGRGRVSQATDGTYSCQFCGKWFSGKSVYQTHMIAIHSLHVYKRYLPEGTTEEELNEVIKNAFDYHIRYPRDESKKQYGCPYCPYRYPHPSHLRLHIIRGHFKKIANKVFEDKGMINGDPEGERYLGIMSGEGFEIEFENGNMDVEEEEESSMFPVDYQNGHENQYETVSPEGDEGDGQTELGEEQIVSSRGSVEGKGEKNAEEDEEEDYDQPPILMRESYSLTENVIGQNSDDDDDGEEEGEGDAEDSIPIPIVQSDEIFGSSD